MKAGLIFALSVLSLTNQLTAQPVPLQRERCSSLSYQQEQLKNDLSLAEKMNAVETFTRQHITNGQNVAARTEGTIIRIPVVVHILYHLPSEKISDAQVQSQIMALNKCFRRQNADTINTPARFKLLAADCEIEFQLAISDPRRRSTSGIIRKYTPIARWEADDKMKFSSEMGDDAWDPKSYLNIWVCNLEQVAGYSSVMGGAENKDGIVMGFPAFGTINTKAGYDMGKTAVHEVGHWLGLKHLWGDTDCGEDGVADTPKQAWYNIDCPTGIRISCNNGPNGDMYMNYMDFTSDACMNMFTQGQKARIKALFEAGRVRNSILSSKGLSMPLIAESSLPEQDPKWLEAKLYPNPAASELNLDFSYDARWMGKTIFISNLGGQTVMNVLITSKNQRIDISKLKPGMYFLAAKKDDGESIKQKFIKL